MVYTGARMMNKALHTFWVLGLACLGFAGADWWAVELEVQPQAGLIEWLCARLQDNKTMQSRSSGEGEGAR